MSTKQTQSPFEISAQHDAERRFVITRDDEDRIVQTGRQIIAACNLQVNVTAWFDNLQLVLGDVVSWCEKTDSVDSCWVEPRSDKVVLSFLPKSGRFDFDLADKMIDLDHQLQQAGVGYVRTQQVPPSQVSRFVDALRALKIYSVERSKVADE
ncbi:MAG: hypothetical protein ACFCVE_09780 [Phycisphaerae bacterium]